MDGLPTKTGDFLTLPNGTQVYVRVLGELDRREAMESADLAAALSVRKYRKGGAAFLLTSEEISEMSVEEQSAYLAETAFLLGELAEEIDAKQPLPERPERGELTEDAFGAALETWEAETAKVTQKRGELAEKLFDEERKRAAALTAKVRTERCLVALRRRKYREMVNARFPIEILFRATRKAESVHEKFFADIQELLDEDAMREALTVFYFSLIDPVKPAEIPTSPAG